MSEMGVESASVKPTAMTQCAASFRKYKRCQRKVSYRKLNYTSRAVNPLIYCYDSFIVVYTMILHK